MKSKVKQGSAIYPRVPKYGTRGTTTSKFFDKIFMENGTGMALMINQPVKFLSYEYPDMVQVLVEGKLYIYRASEFWARKAIVIMRFGNGWKGLSILKRNGREVKKDERMEI